MAKYFFQYYTSYSKLYPKQIKSQKQNSAINAVAILVNIIKKKWKKKKLADAIFIDVKTTFNYIAKSWLFCNVVNASLRNYLIFAFSFIIIAILFQLPLSLILDQV